MTTTTSSLHHSRLEKFEKRKGSNIIRWKEHCCMLTLRLKIRLRVNSTPNSVPEVLIQGRGSGPQGASGDFFMNQSACSKNWYSDRMYPYVTNFVRNLHSNCHHSSCWKKGSVCRFAMPKCPWEFGRNWKKIQT